MEYNFDEIYKKLMIILVANESIIYSQYKLYDLVLNKFFDFEKIKTVPQEFKYKFMIVLRSLMSKSKDVEVYKENNVYYVSYNKSKDTNFSDFTVNNESTWIDENGINKFLLDSNNETQLSYIDYVDPENGNTIYHDILKSNDIQYAEKLIDNYYIDYDLKNKFNKTPIDLVTDIRISNLIIKDLNNKLNTIIERVDKLENKKNIEDYTLYEIIKIIFINFLVTNEHYIIKIISILAIILVFRLIINI
jgi:hypothetical protein